jgi:hypothetical protein
VSGRATRTLLWELHDAARALLDDGPAPRLEVHRRLMEAMERAGEALVASEVALGQLRHLYAQMLAGRDTGGAARGLLGPAIEALEQHFTVPSRPAGNDAGGRADRDEIDRLLTSSRTHVCPHRPQPAVPEDCRHCRAIHDAVRAVASWVQLVEGAHVPPPAAPVAREGVNPHADKPPGQRVEVVGYTSGWNGRTGVIKEVLDTGMRLVVMDGVDGQTCGFQPEYLRPVFAAPPPSHPAAPGGEVPAPPTGEAAAWERAAGDIVDILGEHTDDGGWLEFDGVTKLQHLVDDYRARSDARRAPPCPRHPDAGVVCGGCAADAVEEEQQEHRATLAELGSLRDRLPADVEIWASESSPFAMVKELEQARAALATSVPLADLRAALGEFASQNGVSDVEQVANLTAEIRRLPGLHADLSTARAEVARVTGERDGEIASMENELAKALGCSGGDWTGAWDVLIESAAEMAAAHIHDPAARALLVQLLDAERARIGHLACHAGPAAERVAMLGRVKAQLADTTKETP